MTFANHLDTTHQKAIQLYQQGRFKEGLALLESVQKIAKQDPHLLNSLGMFHLALGAPDKAIKFYKKALKSLDRDPMIWANYAKALELSNKLNNAQQAYKKSLKLQPDNFAVLNNLSLILIKINQLDHVDSYLNKAISLRPNHPAGHCNLGIYFEACGDDEKALNAYQKAAELAPDAAIMQFYFAESLAANNRQEEAIDIYHKAITLNKNFADAYVSLGRKYIEIGQLEQAEKYLRKSLSLKIIPDAFFKLVLLNCLEKDDPIIAQMQDYSQTAPKDDQEAIHFGMASLFDHYKEYDKAFDHLEKANQIKRQKFDIKPKEVDIYFAALAKNVTSDLVKTLQINTENTTVTPIFIVGMPRSGTTLVEQILSKHEKVEGGGELPYLENAITAYAPNYFKGQIDLSADVLQKIRDDYLDHVQKRAKGKPYITDKLPKNFEHIGLIRIIFPDARLIHTQRDPLDICFSCYQQNFGSQLPHFYALDDIAFYYNHYARLMTHWSEEFGPHIYHLAYENLIEDQKGQTQALYDYCQLDFCDDHLNFHDQKRVVNTASYVQVRQPIYKKSVKRWKNYEAHLAPLMKALEL